ncbi:unnamed protein product [Symbiodinium sp. CCMP2456]|nr:unnamed protein product [Symbiodinium sp. CCMP2456]
MLLRWMTTFQACLGVTDDENLMKAMLESGYALVEIIRGEQRQGLQLGWFKFMVRTGKQPELESLDTSVLSLLDQQAGDFWRSTQALAEAEAATKENGEISADKASVKNIMLNLIQVYSVNQEEMKSLGFKDVIGTMNTARTRAILALAKLHDAMQKDKGLVIRSYNELKSIVTSMQAGNEAEIRATLTNLSMQGEQEAQQVMQSMAVREYEETIDLVKTWAQESVFQQPDLAEMYLKLHECNDEEPKSVNLCPVIACVMGSELMFNPEAVKADTHQQVSKFFQYCQSTLKLPKKDLPKMLVEKLEKIAKDRVVIVSRDSKMMVQMMPPPSPSPRGPSKKRAASESKK